MKKMRLGQRISQLFSSGTTDGTLADLEDALIEGDVGTRLSSEIVDQLRNEPGIRSSSESAILELLKHKLEPFAVAYDLRFDSGDLNVVLVLGVNGVGKTTTIARLAKFYMPEFGPARLLLCAGDTFRAAAAEQLEIHAQRLGVRIVMQPQGADAGSVVFDAIESSQAKDQALVLVDTAGRMHNKADLMSELAKIDRIIRSHTQESHYHKMLVVDATTGQNGLRQAEVFHNAIGVDSLCIAKFDSSGKAGTALAIKRDLGIPVSFVGTGETYESLEAFDAGAYLEALLG